MSLNQKFCAMIGCLVAGIVVMLLTDSTLGTGIGVGLVCVGAAIDFAGMRCPHCRAWLGSNPNKRCKSCGREIDFSTK